MTNYPAKPKVAPQTGRIPQVVDNRVKFLEGVTIPELRKMMNFKKDYLFLFLVKHLEKKIRTIETSVSDDIEYARDPILLAFLQGEKRGIREFEKTFTEVEIEYNRRVAMEEALNQGER